MTKNFVETETAVGFRKIYKNEAVLVLTDRPGVTWHGVIRVPGLKMTLVRYNEEGTIREQKIPNLNLVPVKAKPKADIPSED